MDRRKFIKKSGTLSMAVAGLPLAKKLLTQNTYSVYTKKKDPSLPNQSEYSIEVFHSALKNFSTVGETDKVLKFYIFYYKEANQTVSTSLLNYSFTISSVVKDSKDDTVYIVKTKNGKRNSGELVWPKEIPANPVFRIIIDESAKLLNSKGATIAEMLYQEPNDDDMGCFITTACVTERGLADDCDALTTLRYLRSNYMSKTAQGKKLLAEYQTLGPAVVAAIADCENRTEIYDYLYQHMITPAVAMIKHNKYQQAVDWYQGFAEKLKENYC
jgi:hypothetical protein